MATIVGLARVLAAIEGKFSKGIQDRGAIGPWEQMQLHLQDNGLYGVKSPDSTEWLSWDRDADGNLKLSYRPDEPGQPGPWELWKYDEANHRIISAEFPEKDFYIAGTVGDVPPTAPVFGDAVDVHISGENFYTEDNSLHRVQGVTFFTDFLKFLQKDLNRDANEVLRSLGVNTKRVLGCTFYVGDLNPYHWSDYYDKLDRYFEYQKAEGFNVLFVAIARDGNLPVDLASCKDFVAKTSEIAGRWPHVQYCIANEPYKNLPPGVKPQDLAGSIHDSVRCYELGASPDPKAPYEPPGTFATEHTPRDSEWDRKFRHIQETREHLHLPTVSGEPMGAEGTDIPGKRSNEPQKFLEYFAGAAMYGGGVFHSTALITADIPTGIELDCLKAASRAWKYVPKKFLEGEFRYFFADFSAQNPVPALKFYGVELGDEGICCLTRRYESVELKPISGWRIVKGPIENSVIYLERV